MGLCPLARRMAARSPCLDGELPPVNHFLLQEREQGKTMHGTFGQRGGASSQSVCLQSSLANKLQVLMAGRGSTMFRLTWKHWDMPSGRQICAQRAWAHRTSDNDCTSWLTPIRNDARRSDYTYNQGNKNKIMLKLPGQAKLASWATPVAREAGGTPEQFLRRKVVARLRGAKLGISLTSLSLQAQLVGIGPRRTGSSVPPG